jgi:hypothetical protein
VSRKGEGFRIDLVCTYKIFLSWNGMGRRGGRDSFGAIASLYFKEVERIGEGVNVKN